MRIHGLFFSPLSFLLGQIKLLCVSLRVELCLLGIFELCFELGNPRFEGVNVGWVKISRYGNGLSGAGKRCGCPMASSSRIYYGCRRAQRRNYFKGRTAPAILRVR